MMIVNIFENYREANATISPPEYLLLFGFIFLIGLLYMCDNPVNPISETFKFKNELTTIRYIFLFGIILAGFLKVKVIFYSLMHITLGEYSKQLLNKYK
jgi:O-antigen ligase